MMRDGVEILIHAAPTPEPRCLALNNRRWLGITLRSFYFFKLRLVSYLFPKDLRQLKD